MAEVTHLNSYVLPGEEFEDVVLEPVKPVKPPEIWMGPVSARNMDYLGLAIEALGKLDTPVAHELQMLYVQLDLFRPGASHE